MLKTFSILAIVLIMFIIALSTSKADNDAGLPKDKIYISNNCCNATNEHVCVIAGSPVVIGRPCVCNGLIGGGIICP